MKKSAHKIIAACALAGMALFLAPQVTRGALVSEWGGGNVRVTITDTAQFEFPCAHGNIAPGQMKAFAGKRSFNVLGNYVGDRATGLVFGQGLPIKLVHYKGGFHGNRLEFTIIEAHTGQEFGSYTVFANRHIEVHKCY